MSDYLMVFIGIIRWFLEVFIVDSVGMSFFIIAMLIGTRAKDYSKQR